MKYLLARPYPDEPLGSVWIRTVRQTDVPIAVATRVVTGGEKLTPSLFYSGQLRAIGAALRIPPAVLLWEHTVFPYATAFYTPELLAKAVVYAYQSGVELRGLGSIIQSVSDYSRLRRFCPLCARQELTQFGETYWHRLHNLPGVVTCMHHGIRLHVTTIPTVSRRWQDELPHDLMRRPEPPEHDRATAFERHLAWLTWCLLKREPLTVLERHPNWYRDGIDVRGLATPGRKVECEKLAAWMRTFVDDPAALGLPERDQSFLWLAHMIRPRTGQPIVPLKHLLFETALAFQTGSELPLLNYRATGFRGLATEAADAAFAKAVRAVAQRYLRLGERRRIQDVLEEAGCWTRFRHNSKAYPAVKEAIAWMKTTAIVMRPNWGKGLSGRRSIRQHDTPT